MADEQVKVKVASVKMLNGPEIKKLAKAGNKRVGRDFLVAWDRIQRQKLEACIAYHNAGKKTMDAEVVAYIYGK